MKKMIILSLLVVLLFLVGCGLDVRQGAVAGQAVKFQKEATSGDEIVAGGTICQDTDAGKSTYVKGMVTIGEGKNSFTAFTDSCKNSALTEYYCEPTKERDFVAKKYYVECANGCVDEGACSQTEEVCSGTLTLRDPLENYGYSFLSDSFSAVGEDYALGYNNRNFLGKLMKIDGNFNSVDDISNEILNGSFTYGSDVSVMAGDAFVLRIRSNGPGTNSGPFKYIKLFVHQDFQRSVYGVTPITFDWEYYPGFCQLTADCLVNSECVSGQCLDRQCVDESRMIEGGSCGDHMLCGDGLVCENNVCEPWEICNSNADNSTC